MAKLVRQCAVLVAIYSIALQSVLLGFLHASHVSFDPVATICTSDGSGRQHAPSQRPDAAPDSCCFLCRGASPLIVPQGATLSLSSLFDLQWTPFARAVI
jgi:hypothetical protein